MTTAKVGALASAIISFALGATAYIIGVLSTTGQTAEASVLSATEINYDPGPPLSLVSVPFVALSIGIIALFAGIFHGVARAVAIIIASAACVLLSQLLKTTVLERPELFEIGADNTFPSGHTAFFAAFALSLIFMSPPKLRGFMSVLAACLLSYVCEQILVSAWHRPSDVFGAMMLAMCVFSLAAYFTQHSSKLKTSANRIAAFLLGIFIFVNFVVCAVASVHMFVTGENSSALIASIALCIATSCAICRSTMRLARN